MRNKGKRRERKEESRSERQREGGKKRTVYLIVWAVYSWTVLTLMPELLGQNSQITGM